MRIVVSRSLASLCVFLGAVGCIPYYDFTPCEETGTCDRFDATERGELGDLATEPPGDAEGDAVDAADVAAMDTPDSDADVSEDDGASVVDTAGDADDAPEVAACAAGTADCDGLPANGCEADTRTSSMHCGACGVACAAPEHGSARCAAGRCEVTCDAGHARAGAGCVAIAAPRLVAPLSPHTVTSQTPRLRWALGAGSDGVRVELCRERACATVVHRLDALGTSALTPMVLTPGAWFWRAVGMQGAAAGVTYSATWELFVGHRSALVNTAWGQTTDLNGDGYADLVFAAGSTIYVYAGSLRGLATTPSTLTPVPGQEVRGLSARGGDVDGDGFGDLLVHVVAPREALGVAMLYRGGAGGVGRTAARTYDPATSLPTLVGDVNGDGYGDLGLSDAILYGGEGGPPDTRTTPPTNERITFPAGDVNGDGLADAFLCTLARLRSNCTTRTGASSGPLGEVGTPIEVLGWPRALHDADGDGRADFATLLPTGSPPGQWIWYGGTFSATLVFVSESGTLVNAGVGDIDRDGFADSLLTALDASGAFASLNIVAGGLDRRWNARRMLYVSPGVPFSGSLGLAAVGDSDGDGIDEFVVVSSPLRALYLFGAMATTAGVPTRTLPFPSAAASLITSQ